MGEAPLKPPLTRARWGLRARLLGLVGATVTVVVLGQALVSLSAQVDAEDARVRAELSARATRLAAACVRPTDAESRRSCAAAVAQEAGRVEVLGVRVVDHRGETLHEVGSWPASAPGGPSAGLPLDRSQEDGSPDTSAHLASPWEDALEYTASAPLLSPAGVVGRVALRATSGAVPRAVRRGLRSALGMGLVWLVLAMALGTLLVRRILTPVHRLTELACALARGDDAQVPPEPGARPDELGVLAGALRTLTLRLSRERAENERLMGALGEANAGLQERVDDVTADLRELTAYLEAVIDSLEEGVLTFDADARLVHVGRSAARTLDGLGELKPGTPGDRVLPASVGLGALVRAAGAADGPRKGDAGLAESGAGRRSELALTVEADGAVRVTDPAGEELGWDGPRALVVRVSPLSRSDASHEAVQGAVVTVGDRTEEVRAAARHSRHERLVSLGTIGAGLAHELGNYMHTIHGYSSLLVRELQSGSDARADAQAIHDENARAVALLDRFLEFARPREVWVQPEPLARLVDEALEVCAVQLRKGGVTVERAIPHTLPDVVCDARLMVQVLVNLILNAVDAMDGAPVRQLTVRGPSSGAVTGAAASPPVGPRADTPASSAPQRAGGPFVRLEVEDTGAGIAPEDLRRVFEPLYTTKGEAGTGLGLAVCQQVVDRHGGTLSVRSTPGAGAVFALELPTEGAGTHNAPPASAAAQHLHGLGPASSGDTSSETISTKGDA